MKKYKYTAYNIDHKKFSGVYFARSEEHLRQLLSEQELFLVSWRVIADKKRSAFFSLMGKVKMKELTYFCRQLAIMINASIELINCLDILKNQSFSKTFKNILETVYEDVKSGTLLSDAMAKHKKVFPNFFRNMVYVGEMSSSLEKVLENIADYYEQESRTKAKVKGALVYPITLLIMTIGILVVMMLVVIPTFRESFSQMDIDMPALTMAIFSLSDFVMQNWSSLLLGVVGIIVACKLFVKIPAGRMLVDTLYMNIGFLKRYQVAKTTAVFARSFGLLLSSGMHIVDAMDVVEKIIPNKYIQKRFHKAIDDVRGGESLTTAITNMKVFPPMLLQMIGVGEKTASLDESLLRTCQYFDEEHANALGRIMSLLQPILMMIMGVSIAVIFIAVYSPMLSIMENV